MNLELDYELELETSPARTRASILPRIRGELIAFARAQRDAPPDRAAATPALVGVDA